MPFRQLVIFGWSSSLVKQLTKWQVCKMSYHYFGAVFLFHQLAILSTNKLLGEMTGDTLVE
jgi:hypothetical protein